MDNSLNKLLQDNITVIEKCDGKHNFNVDLDETTKFLKREGKLFLNYDESSIKFSYLYEDIIVAVGTGRTKNNAFRNAKRNLARYLSLNCYRIRQKLEFYSPEKPVQRLQSDKEHYKVNDEIDPIFLPDSKFYKMLYKDRSATEGEQKNKPVDVFKKKQRTAGIGYRESGFDEKYIIEKINDYKKDVNVLYDLVFSIEFSANERQKISEIAVSMGLVTKCFKNQESSEFLVISKEISSQQLREELLKDDSLLKMKYELIMPEELGDLSSSTLE